MSDEWLSDPNTNVSRCVCLSVSLLGECNAFSAHHGLSCTVCGNRLDGAIVCV